jgi:uncharacterized protein (TIGR03435 family)
MRPTIPGAAVVPSAFLSVLLVFPNAFAQQPSGARPTFEVATIKRNHSVETDWSFGAQPGGRWRMVNRSIATMIHEAYPTQSRELVGAPAWVISDKYDVIAKGEGNPTRELIRQMLQTLLLERFKLASHVEMQERPVFALVIARNDGRPGPGLQLSKLDCDAVNKARSAGRKPDGPMPANGAPPCGWAGNGESIRFGGLPLSRLGEAIAGQMDGRVVIDKTGLAGNYEFTLSYSILPPPNDTPSVFTALQEQLGLKLAPDRAPVQVLVIDRIERPTED